MGGRGSCGICDPSDFAIFAPHRLNSTDNKRARIQIPVPRLCGAAARDEFYGNNHAAHSIARHTRFRGFAALAVVPGRCGPVASSSTSRPARSSSSEDAFQRWYPASLTKLMTAYVAFRAVQPGQVSLASPVRITKAAAKQPPSKMGYKPGPILTLDNALKIIMVKSANDVAAAIGDSLGGSRGRLRRPMNAEAARLGMTGSQLRQPAWPARRRPVHDRPRPGGPGVGAAPRVPAICRYFSTRRLVRSASKAIRQLQHADRPLRRRRRHEDRLHLRLRLQPGLLGDPERPHRGRGGARLDLGRSRAEKSAAMLARGFAVTTDRGPTLGGLQPSGSGQTRPPTCTTSFAPRKRAPRSRKGTRSAGQGSGRGQRGRPEVGRPRDLNRPRELVTVSLGGATGPVPRAVAAAFAEETAAGAARRAVADMPPRPAMPPGAEPVAMQGDSAVGHL